MYFQIATRFFSICALSEEVFKTNTLLHSDVFLDLTVFDWLEIKSLLHTSAYTEMPDNYCSKHLILSALLFKSLSLSKSNT